MTNLERRLQHAARELREIEIEPPPVESLGIPPRATGITGRVPTLVMPVLFVLGGLAIVAGGLGRHVDAPAAVPAEEVAVSAALDGDVDSSDALAATAPALTARQEIALIASLAPAPPAAADHAASAGEVRTLSRHYR